MCMYFDQLDTEKLRAQGTVVLEKVVQYRDGKLFSAICGDFEYTAGWNGDHNPAPTDLQNNDEIEDGVLHVFTKHADAVYCQGKFQSRVIVPVTCHAEDLVAAGNGYVGLCATAGYRRLYIDPQDYQKAIEEGKRGH